MGVAGAQYRPGSDGVAVGGRGAGASAGAGVVVEGVVVGALLLGVGADRKCVTCRRARARPGATRGRGNSDGLRCVVNTGRGSSRAR